MHLTVTYHPFRNKFCILHMLHQWRMWKVWRVFRYTKVTTDHLGVLEPRMRRKSQKEKASCWGAWRLLFCWSYGIQHGRLECICFIYLLNMLLDQFNKKTPPVTTQEAKSQKLFFYFFSQLSIRPNLNKTHLVP